MPSAFSSHLMSPRSPFHIAAIDAPHRLGLLGHNLHPTIQPSAVGRQFLVLKNWHCTPPHFSAYPNHVHAERLALCLDESAEQNDKELAGLSKRVDVLCLKDYLDAASFQSMHDVQAVHCALCESGQQLARIVSMRPRLQAMTILEGLPFL